MQQIYSKAKSNVGPRIHNSEEIAEYLELQYESVFSIHVPATDKKIQNCYYPTPLCWSQALDVAVRTK